MTHHEKVTVLILWTAAISMFLYMIIDWENPE